MSMRILFLILCVLCLFAGDEPQLPWVPATLDDWTALQRSSSAYAEQTRAARRTLFPHPGDRFWGRIWHAIDIPKPPDGTGAEDLLILDLMMRTGPRSSESCGQEVVWRGADGKAIGATIYVQWAQLPKSDPPLFTDEKQYLDRLDQLFAAAPPPVGAWRIVKGPDHWCAIWQRDGGRVATIDDRQGKAPALRPEDIRWLSSPPQPRAGVEPVATVDEAAYTARVAAHAQVQAALARARSIYPVHPLAIGSIAAGSSAEAHGWKLGDILASVDGQEVQDEDGFLALRARKGGANRIVLVRSDGSRFETQVQPGRLGICGYKLAADPGLIVLRLAGTHDVDAAVVLYACDDAALVATALDRMGGKLGRPVTAFLNAWQASYAGDYGRCVALLTGKDVLAEPRLSRAISDLLTANRIRSGRLLWAYPEFAQRNQADMLLRHLVKDLVLPERFSLFEAGLAKETYSASASESVRPVHSAAETLLRLGAGTPTATDDALTVDVRLAGLPSRCRLDFESALKPVELTHKGNMMQSPVEQYLQLGFAASTKRGFSAMGFGGVRLWLDGSIEVAGATLDRDERTLAWYTVPGRVSVDGATRNAISLIRMGQLQRIEVNGRGVFNAFLPLVAGEAAGEELVMDVETSALATPTSGFKVSMPKAPPKISDF